VLIRRFRALRAAQQGVSRSSAVLLLTVIGVSSTCGRFLLGGLADRVGQRRAVAMMYVGMSIAFLLWAASASFPLLVIVAITYGAFYGGWVALLPPLVAESFGTANLASVIGVLYTSVGVGTLAGPFAAGVFFDILHSYSAAILGSAGLTAIAAGILWLTPSTLNERTP
jgi:MFS family permease